MTISKYRVVSQDANTHVLVELATDLIIGTALTRAEALTVLRTLNKGAGFAGWTPAFFLKTIPLSNSNSEVVSDGA